MSSQPNKLERLQNRVLTSLLFLVAVAHTGCATDVKGAWHTETRVGSAVPRAVDLVLDDGGHGAASIKAFDTWTYDVRWAIHDDGGALVLWECTSEASALQLACFGVDSPLLYCTPDGELLDCDVSDDPIDSHWTFERVD